MTIVTIGIDLAKNVFAVHGVDATGKPALVRFVSGPAAAFCVDRARHARTGYGRAINVIDRMIRIPDVTSLAAMRVLSRQLGRKVGGSTGANFFALCLLASRMRADGLKGSLVTLICDSGERYGHTYYNDDWIAAQGFDLSSGEAALEAFLGSGEPLL